MAITGFDINASVIEHARVLGEQRSELERFLFHVRDATALSDNDRYSLLCLIEFFHFVKAEGLFCNLIGEDAERAAQIIDLYLAPSGYLFIADSLRCDLPNFHFLLENLGWGVKEIVEFQERWVWRYEQNRKAGLSDGHFIVAKPEGNKYMEWGCADELRVLRKSDDFERLARHFHPQELTFLFERQGLRLIYWQPTLFFSTRMGEPFMGCLAVFGKSEVYKYAMGVCGKPFEARAAFYREMADELGTDGKEALGALWHRWEGYLREIEERVGFSIFEK